MSTPLTGMYICILALLATAGYLKRFQFPRHISAKDNQVWVEYLWEKKMNCPLNKEPKPFFSQDIDFTMSGVRKYFKNTASVLLTQQISSSVCCHHYLDLTGQKKQMVAWMERWIAWLADGCCLFALFLSFWLSHFWSINSTFTHWCQRLLQVGAIRANHITGAGINPLTL